MFFCSLLLLVQVSFAQTAILDGNSPKELSILYTNDLHANFEPIKVGWISETRKVGGFAKIAARVKREKLANPNTLYLDAGDFFTGPDICSLTKGEAVIDVMNHMSFDATCIGNHEFDYGWKNMVLQFEKATFPILNGNLFVHDTGNLIWNNPFKIFQKNGLKIGVIGLHGKYAFYDTVSDTMRHGIEAGDEEFYLQHYIDQLKPQVDLVVLLVHEGIPGRQSSKGSVDIERNLQKDIELAAKIKGVDIMITGHAHQGTPQPLTSNGSLIVSTDALGIEIGKLVVHYDLHHKKMVGYQNTLNYLYEDETPDDPATRQCINKWKERVDKISGQKISCISQPLTRSYGEESTMGNMVADGMLHAFPDYELALVNSGGLREDITGPNVTAGDLISAFPFPNTVVKVELKGVFLRELFEHAADQTNGVLQVSSGMVIQYNDTLPLGSRVVRCTLNGKALEDQRMYKVLTNNFLVEGGDGFLSFKKAASKDETHLEVVQTMISYLKTFAVYQPKLTGRVVKLNK